MLVTGGLLELKLTTLARICDHLKDVGLVIFMALGFEKASPAYILKVFRLLHEDIVAKPPPLIIDICNWICCRCQYLIIPTRVCCGNSRMVHFKVSSIGHIKGHFAAPSESCLLLELNQSKSTPEPLSTVLPWRTCCVKKKKFCEAHLFIPVGPEKKATVCSLSITSCFVPCQLAQTSSQNSFQLFHQRKGPYWEHETELPFLGGAGCCGIWIFLLPISMSPTSQRGEQNKKKLLYQAVDGLGRDMIKTPNFLLQSWPCPFRCLVSTQAQLRRSSLYGCHFVFSCKSLIWLSPQGQKSLQRDSTPSLPPSLTAAYLTLNAHLQINSRCFRENGEKEMEKEKEEETTNLWNNTFCKRGRLPVKKNCRWGRG